MSVERKVEKRSLYVDLRDDDNMESWDEEKLQEVIGRKHGESNSRKPTTEIVNLLNIKEIFFFLLPVITILLIDR